MKKILGLFILFLSIISFRIVVKAEAFKATDFISGVFINRVGDDGVAHPFKGQYMIDEEGNIVYCIEPFAHFDDKVTDYSGTDNLISYGRLSASQIRKLELLTYYGYGYNNRTSSDWYVITQFLIWQTVSPNNEFYFTDTYGGNKITKYENEINELLNEVNNHDNVPDFIKNYTVNLNGKLDINELNSNDYEIVSNSYNSNLENGLHLENIVKDGKIVFRRKSNRFNNKIMIYDSSNNQDLIKPGNISNPEYTININVTKGDITLDILKDTSVYTVESNFKNTCYEIKTKDWVLVDKVCADDEMVYKTLELPYGKYVVKQVNYGIGFKPDTKTYDITIDKSNEHPKVTLENLLIRNTIEIIKYACKDKVCAYESGASFEVYDKLGNKVDTLVTNDLGYTKIVLGYGTYIVEQISGIDDYTLAESYQEKIVDEESEHKKELFNYYIEPFEPVPQEDIPEEDIPTEEIQEEIPIEHEVVELPPDTGVLGVDSTLVCFGIYALIKKIYR